MNLLKTAGCVVGLFCAVSSQAADTKFELRLAEEKKAEGLVEAKVADSMKKIYLHKKAVLTNADVAAARVVKEDGRYSLHLDFNADGAKKLARASAAHIGKPLAVLIDGKVVFAPVLREKVSGKAVISGNFTKEELDRIASDLK